MSYKEKYLKYKNKYLELKKQQGGFIIEEIEETEQNIIKDYKKLSDKGTQNCGVYIKDDKILVCNNNLLTPIQIDFLTKNNTENLQVYPILYKIYHSTDTNPNKYFYLWERMDGDLRDFFLNHIPEKILRKLYPYMTQQDIDLFIEFLKRKTYKDDLYVTTDMFDENKYALLSNAKYNNNKLLYKKEDEKYIIDKLNIIQQFTENTTLTWDFATIMNNI